MFNAQISGSCLVYIFSNIVQCSIQINQCTSPHLSLNRKGRRGTTDDFTTSFLLFFLQFSTALWDLASSRPVYSLMLSSHLFLCRPCFLPTFTVPCKMVSDKPNERDTCPYRVSLRLFYNGQVFVWPDCLLDLGTDFLVGNMVYVREA